MVVVVFEFLEMRLIDLLLLANALIAMRADTEEADHVLQGFGLRREFFSSAGEFLGAGGVSLCDQANLADRSVDLAHTGGLLPSGRASFSLKLVNGTTQRCSMPSQRRQCGDLTFRMLVTLTMRR